MKILFLHGWTSVPGGLKPTFLAKHGHEVFNPKLPDEDFEEAIRIAQAEFDRHKPDVIVGSSRGGAVAMNVRSGQASLVLLCPAWKKWGIAKTVKPGTVILHSRADEVVPFAHSQELVLASGLPRRNGWTFAEHAGDRTPGRTQRLLNRASWEAYAAMGVIRPCGRRHRHGPGARARRQGRWAGVPWFSHGYKTWVCTGAICPVLDETETVVSKGAPTCQEPTPTLSPSSSSRSSH